MYLTLISSVALLAANVRAHGSVTAYTIAGKDYPGYEGFSPSSGPPTIQRQWKDYNPVTSVSDPKLRCNGGTSAPLNAQVAAGSTVTAKWKQWTHQQGPVMVWMYKCAGAFTSCDGSGKSWFKIDQEGLNAPPLSSNNWATGKIYKDKKWTSKIPATLPAGNYLIRHEIIALHQANSPQFYAECAQLAVTGGGSAMPSGQYMASIPGYATANDPGIKVDVYSSKATTYQLPGPAVWKG
ncbi:family 61 putative glycoside hydrolase [Microthyrium microscopicum]|uniref:AA9 family lytic polysaccharide monooxygenase n=1 Tax=Microthyrium microscopicum TaxID=703497 RepID=A0A6A6TT68_9PEZI|nr:family 61 putative glycoside hydrolase [Microthyrium microscopicum]